MLSKIIINAAFFVGLATAFCGSASADIVATIPEYNGPASFDFDPADYPLAIANIGTFAFAIPAGLKVVGATISGTFGNNVETNTATSDYFVNGKAIQVAGCDDPSANCAQGFAPTPWSYTFTAGNLATLSAAFASGSLDFNVIQNFAGSVQTGTTKLDLQLTPEPSTFVFLGGALAGLAVLRRRKNPKAC